MGSYGRVDWCWLRRPAAALKARIKKALFLRFAQYRSLQFTQGIFTGENTHGNGFDQRKLYGAVAGLLCKNRDTD
jgi:hypothetical protein